MPVSSKHACALRKQDPSIKAGFTLIELSIVLVIIGLLVGGTLVGQNLIEQSYIQKTISETSQYKASVHAFEVRFKALPGDMRDATSFFTDVQNGDGNWKIQYWNEGYYSWMELQQAGLIPGNYVGMAVAQLTPGENVPSSAIDETCGYSFAHEVEVAWQNNFNIKGNVLHLGRATATQTTKAPCFTPIVAYTIDSKLDDGMPATGVVHSWDVNFTPDCITASAPDAEYDMIHEDVACALLFQL